MTLPDKEPQLVTTGKASELLGVTPDTVLRWIKSGRLEATKTPGGHNRISLQEIEPLIRKSHPAPTAVQEPECALEPLHCWEYLSTHGELRNECQRCIVYQARATQCFRLAEMQEEIGHAKLFCQTSCEDCLYYRRVKRLATHVLVITSDQKLITALNDDPRDDLSIRFANNGYEASTVIGSFRPGFVVLDCDPRNVNADELVECLAADNRVPGLRIIFAVRPGETWRPARYKNEDFVVGVLQKPLDARCIEALIDCVPVDVPTIVEQPRDEQRQDKDVGHGLTGTA
jgi:excisionase family DNA binding protein